MAAGTAGPSDEALMRDLALGDAVALEALMERYWHPLLRFAARSVPGLDEAEDIAQEVFVRLWRDRAEWRRGGSPRAYLYRVARNLSVDRARHAAMRARRAVELRPKGRPPTPIEQTMRSELSDDLERAVERLAPRRREAFVLVRFQGLSLKEASEVMDLTPRTVANHVYLAATELADALSGHLTP